MTYVTFIAATNAMIQVIPWRNLGVELMTGEYDDGSDH
jgi:hypothetical protein